MFATATDSFQGMMVRFRGSPTQQDRRGRILFGDIITAIDDQPVRLRGDLTLILEKKEIGDFVVVTYVRDRREKEVRVRLR